MLQVFPDSVMFVQKFIQKMLNLMRSLLHIDACHRKSHFYAGRSLVSIQKLCCSRGGRRKKAVGGENYPWAFSNSWSEVHFFCIQIRGKHDPRLAPSRSHHQSWSQQFQPSQFYFCTAQLRLTRTQCLPVCPGTRHPHSSLSTRAEQTAAPKTNTAPDSPDISLRAATGITRAIFPVLS